MNTDTLVLHVPKDIQIFILNYEGPDRHSKQFANNVKNVFREQGLPIKNEFKANYLGRKPVKVLQFSENTDPKEVIDILQMNHIPYEYDSIFSLGNA